MEDAEGLDVELLEAVSLENGDAVAVHPLLNGRKRHRVRHAGRGEERCQECQGKGEKSALHVRTNSAWKAIHFDSCSLVTESFDRIEFRRFCRRVDAKEDAEERAEAHGKEDGPEGRVDGRELDEASKEEPR